MPNLADFLAELRLLRVFRVAAVYTGIAFVIIQIIVGCGPSGAGEKQTDTSPSGPFFTEITDQSQLHFIHNPVVDSSYYMPESIGSGGAFLDLINDNYYFCPATIKIPG